MPDPIHSMPQTYLRSLPSPESFVRLLRREFRARMLGAGLLTGGLVGAPFLVACVSCPGPYLVRYAYEVTPEIAARALPFQDEDEACAAMCGGPVQSCHRAQMLPGEPGPETRGHYSTMDRPVADSQELPEPREILICEVMKQRYCGGAGRPPEGLVERAVPMNAAGARSPLVAYAEQTAHLEAASAISFIQLATELEAHGAPAHLVAAAERSAVDEVRHARAASVLALSLGGSPLDPIVAIPAPRPLAQVLRENAAIGGVEENYGAWVLTRQMEQATDERVLGFVGAIVGDEQRHARLAGHIDDWGTSRIGSADRASNAEQVSLAWAELSASQSHEPDQALASAAGMPSASESCEWIERRSA